MQKQKYDISIIPLKCQLSLLKIGEIVVIGIIV